MHYIYKYTLFSIERRKIYLKIFLSQQFYTESSKRIIFDDNMFPKIFHFF